MKNVILFFFIGITQLALDTVIYSLLTRLGVDIVIANFSSRALAAITGYLLNGKLTFKSSLSTSVFIKFCVYWLFMTAMSSLLLVLSRKTIAEVIPNSYVDFSSKIIVEFILFFISYLIAKVWVYKK
ncbi:GtrA family protein [Pantoea agglomerans]